MINWRVLDNVPLLFYILAAKTLILCLAFAGVKLYQQKKIDAALKQQLEAKRKLAQETQELIDSKKDD
ncbi:small integral membrane protein 11-like [Neoarius graeffei]|uniref:small integral membrane protein 11-like n=1 Tax=Neoarius graeffei TaxID=443677 RepID=UPI00298D5403|nr:small integral membrane protein 11-like [Neoarius graeffei]